MHICTASLHLTYPRSTFIKQADWEQFRRQQDTDMAWYESRRILAFLTNPIPRKVVGGKLNPKLLMIARRAYWIQSRVLCIPDRFGLISSGPPLLRALQAYNLAYHISLDVVNLLLIPITLLIISRILGPGRRRSAYYTACYLTACCFWNLVMVYVQEVFFNPMRAPDYDWEALHRELGLVQPYYSLGVNSGRWKVADR